MKSFIVQLWERIFRFLRCVSVFYIIEKRFPNKTPPPAFVDSWVLLNSFLSGLSIFIVRYDVQKWAVCAFVIWGALRIFEIVIYQINVLFFDPESKEYALEGYRRSIILALHNYLELILWFTSFYLQSRTLFNDPKGVLNSWLGSIYYSIVTITTLGYGDVTPSSDRTMFLVICQTVIGVFFIAVIVARFISYLPKPKTLEKEKK